MNLLIDAGNTRIKWALANGADWLRSGVLPTAEATDLPQHLAGHIGNLDADLQPHCWVSNVVGNKVAEHIQAACAARQYPVHFITAQASQCGVLNNYAQPSQLGSDRWAALIAAWHLTGKSCLIVSSGTATTIDALSSAGTFSGGLIMPGIELMQRSLHTATSQLKPEQGKYAPFPRNTADAILSGAIQATCGAIERQHALLDDTGALVLLSGGAASLLLPHLNLPVQIMDNPVLQGLLLIAQNEDAK